MWFVFFIKLTDLAVIRQNAKPKFLNHLLEQLKHLKINVLTPSFVPPNASKSVT